MAIPSQVADVRWNLNPPPVLDPHAYFNQWAADPRIAVAYSLRTQAQLDFLAKAWHSGLTTALPGWSVDPGLDAARGAIWQVYPADGDLVPQLWIRVPVSAGTATYVWDVYVPSDWSNEPIAYVTPDTHVTRPGSGIPGKSFQVRRVSDSIHMETQLNNLTNQLPNIAHLTWRTYGLLGPGASNSKLPNGFSSDTVQPLLAQYVVRANTWTRLIKHVEFGGLVSGGQTYNLWSLWALDETRDVIQLYDRVPIGGAPTGMDHFDFEYDSSQQRAPGSPTKYLYNRNFFMLRGLVDPLPLFQKPL